LFGGPRATIAPAPPIEINRCEPERVTSRP
jgi:hypothetical protein